MAEAQIGKFYQARGYTFRVDHVNDVDVYVVRWVGDETFGEAMRVPVATWASEMAGCEPMEFHELLRVRQFPEVARD